MIDLSSRYKPRYTDIKHAGSPLFSAMPNYLTQHEEIRVDSGVGCMSDPERVDEPFLYGYSRRTWIRAMLFLVPFVIGAVIIWGRPFLERFVQPYMVSFLVFFPQLMAFLISFLFPDYFKKSTSAPPVHRTPPAQLDLGGGKHLLSVYAGNHDPSYGVVKGTLTITPHQLFFTPDPFIPREPVTLQRRYITDLQSIDQVILIQYTVPMRQPVFHRFSLWEGTTEVFTLLTSSN